MRFRAKFENFFGQDAASARLQGFLPFTLTLSAGVSIDFSHLLSSARPFSYPAQYHVPAESPLVANSEARNLALPF